MSEFAAGFCAGVAMFHAALGNTKAAILCAAMAALNVALMAALNGAAMVLR